MRAAVAAVFCLLAPAAVAVAQMPACPSANGNGSHCGYDLWAGYCDSPFARCEDPGPSQGLLEKLRQWRQAAKCTKCGQASRGCGASACGSEPNCGCPQPKRGCGGAACATVGPATGVCSDQSGGAGLPTESLDRPAPLPLPEADPADEHSDPFEDDAEPGGFRRGLEGNMGAAAKAPVRTAAFVAPVPPRPNASSRRPAEKRFELRQPELRRPLYEPLRSVTR